MAKHSLLTPDKLKVFESVPDRYLILSPDLYILTASAPYLAATFTSRAEIVGKYVFDAFPDNPDTPQAHSVNNLHASLQQVLSSRKPHQMPLQRYDLPRPPALGGGFEKKYWEPSNTPVLNEQGEVEYIIHKVKDVTEQTKDKDQIQDLTLREQAALLQVEKEQEKLQSIFMQAPVGIAIFEHKEHLISLMNPRMCELLGQPEEVFLGKPLFEALPEVKGQGFEEILSDVFTTGKTFEAREIPSSLTRNGKQTIGFYNLVYQPLRNQKQEITGIIQISIEVTGQVEDRRKAEERERQLQLITDSLPVLIGYLDKERKYRFANQAYEEWFPLKAEELLGRPAREVLGEKAYLGIEKYMDRALAGERLDFEAEMPYRDTFKKHIRTSYIPDVQQGQVVGFYTMVNDITEQVEARRKIEENEKKYRSLFERMEQGFCILEMIFDSENKPVDYRFLETNPMFEKQTGLKNAVGKTARELVPELEKHWFEIYGKVALSGKSARFTEGSEAMGRWFDVHAFRQGDPDSRKVALLFTDISERKQVEENLKRTNSWFQLVNQATQDAIWDWNLETQKITWNEGVLTMFNYKPEEVEPEASWWFNHIHPDDRERVVNGIHEVIDQGKEHWTEEYRYLTGDGGFKIVFDRGFVLHDGAGKAVRMIGSMQDITERKRAEEGLRESENLFRTFANNIQNLAWMAEANGTIYWYNERWKEYTGLTGEEMKLLGSGKVHHPDHLERVRSFLSEAWKKGETWELTFPLKGADGAYRWFLTRAYAVKDSSGRVIRWIGTNTNIDEQKKAETSLAENIRQLKRVNNDLDNFIYTASHDLKAPIINIEGLVKLLHKNLDEERNLNPKTKPLMDMIFSSIARFQNTIKDLTEVAKVENNAEEDLSEVSFQALLEEVKSNIKAQIDDSGASISYDFSQAPSVYFSKKNMRSILYNLLSNAVKYRSPDRPPKIHISTSKADKAHLLLRVEDNGLGIKEKDQKKVFMMFKRLHQHVDGTGIGMAIVKKIIDNNGGRIEIESEVGKGALFKIYFKEKHYPLKETQLTTN